MVPIALSACGKTQEPPVPKYLATYRATALAPSSSTTGQYVGYVIFVDTAESRIIFCPHESVVIDYINYLNTPPITYPDGSTLSVPEPNFAPEDFPTFTESSGVYTWNDPLPTSSTQTFVFNAADPNNATLTLNGTNLAITKALGYWKIGNYAMNNLPNGIEYVDLTFGENSVGIWQTPLPETAYDSSIVGLHPITYTVFGNNLTIVFTESNTTITGTFSNNFGSLTLQLGADTVIFTKI